MENVARQHGRMGVLCAGVWAARLCLHCIRLHKPAIEWHNSLKNAKGRHPPVKFYIFTGGHSTEREDNLCVLNLSWQSQTSCACLFSHAKFLSVTCRELRGLPHATSPLLKGTRVLVASTGCKCRLERQLQANAVSGVMRGDNTAF